MESYYEAYYNVTLNNNYNVENNVLGRCIRVPIGYHGIYEIYFPKVSPNDPLILIPYFKEEYKNNNSSNHNVGAAERYTRNDGKGDIYKYSINSIIIHYISSKEISKDEFLRRNGFSNVFERATEFCKLLQVIKPDCIHREINYYHNNILIKEIEYSKKSEESWESGIYTRLHLKNLYYLKYEELETLIRNFPSRLSLQYSLAYDAWVKYDNSDYRGCILDSVTIVESYIRNSIRNIYKSSGLDDDKIDPILLTLNGIKGANQFLKKIGKPVDLKQWDEIINLRNRIIHAGISVKQKEALKAIELLTLFLSENNVPKFEHTLL